LDERELAGLCRERGVAFAVDLGSGTLVDLGRLGLPHERTVGETLAAGADVVTFSGDKLLGGPQAGLVVGRDSLIAKIRRNPMKRALRVDKMTIAALAAVLQLYRDPESVTERVPALRLIARPADDIRRMAERICPKVRAAMGGAAAVQVVDCVSQIGSGALPTRELASAGLAIRPLAGRSRGGALTRIEAAFRSLPVPVIGRMQEGAFVLDLRCLEEEEAFLLQIENLSRRMTT
jgi:L-seryl-tRNA(Ser) seleniumtransferase